jgi:hypothetical protein
MTMLALLLQRASSLRFVMGNLAERWDLLADEEEVAAGLEEEADD